MLAIPMDLNDKSKTTTFRRIEMAKLFKVLANITACLLFLGGASVGSVVLKQTGTMGAE